MSDKRATLDQLVGELADGMTIGLGGWGSRRKPMAAVRAILRSTLTDLTIVSYGGPDVGLLCDSGKVKKVVFPFVTLDSIATDPLFKKARQSAAIDAMEVDEGMFYLGLLAASQRLPFLPTRSGLGSDVLRLNPSLRTVTSPYADAEELVAMPALRLDAAIIHVNRADAAGSGQILGPDPFFDELFLGAADRRYLTAERIIPTEELAQHGAIQTLCISRLLTDRVVETPNGAHFTACVGDYGRDEAFQKAYVTAAGDPETWSVFTKRYLEVDEEGYQAALRADRAAALDADERSGR
jgi:glutaconate CoA-transferase subunit A